MNPDEIRVTGAVVAYRLFDIGYEIDLEGAERQVSAAAPDTAPERVRPRRLDARALHIKNPPLSLTLGDHRIQVAGMELRASVSARLFDFGVCALQVEVPVPPGTSWDTFGALARGVGIATGRDSQVEALVANTLETVRNRVNPAVERPEVAPVQEDYVVLRVSALADEAGRPVDAEALRDELLVPLLVGERRALSQGERQELLEHRFSYYADDLVILTWDNALIVEPRAHDRDVEFILEFANAQLLELRVYDALLDAELPAMYDRVAEVRRRGRAQWRGYSAVLSRVQTLVADVTETVERAENAVKVTEDVYLARVYDAALALFREPAWRRGMERKLAIYRETYAMLNDEAQARRSELLELLVLLVIVAELVLAVVRH